jgi:hypothetical protein
MQVYASGSTTPIGPVGDFPRLGQNSESMSDNWANTPYVFDRHIVFDPKHGRIILIPPENDRIIQRDFDLNQLLEKSGVDYLVVTSAPNTNVPAGENWRYKIETISNAEGIKFTLEFGPKGMEISNDGTLSWNVPANHSGAEKVVVLIENEKNEAIYHNFELQVK